jgi:SAM-dependent methyltransferase
MGSNMWGEVIASVYDATSAAMFAPSVLNPTVALLEELAQGGPALEFAVGTGRVALPLSARGVVVHGIELSPPMAARLAEKPRGAAVQVTIGDMTAAHVKGDFKLVYVVWNALMNVTTQHEQVAVFRNAARHLAPGGRFVVEVVVPQLRGVPPGEVGRVFAFEPDHVASPIQRWANACRSVRTRPQGGSHWRGQQVLRFDADGLAADDDGGCTSRRVRNHCLKVWSLRRLGEANEDPLGTGGKSHPSTRRGAEISVVTTPSSARTASLTASGVRPSITVSSPSAMTDMVTIAR